MFAQAPAPIATRAPTKRTPLACQPKKIIPPIVKTEPVSACVSVIFVNSEDWKVHLSMLLPT